MATIRILLGIVCFIVIGSDWSVNRNSIAHGRTKNVVATAKNEIGVQEYMENSGPRVDQYNAYVGVKKAPWCASFVSWCFGQAGYPQPRTPWSPALFPANRLTTNPMAGMVLGIYFDHLKRIGHCGIVEEVRGDWIFSIEGNTNLNGSREGDGVYRRMRHIRSIHRFADWLKK
ncbi:MAG: CHAP domain-containing protein [Candidatus Pedobacter colombiensis]|uniref:CHAP domain-containing protein n=1 Tax=Candidatus Pedobacter colombiensis TaxID=3121371 RepID=A0AAJ6B834_9SPHI|nr:CHAP domain-containing protein [Pedobacter sp.]WEK20925.1 MAG: CHAP domain-containing protein [Pedobacter sp.]